MGAAIHQDEVIYNDKGRPATGAFLLTNVRRAVQANGHAPTLSDGLGILPATGP
jgi:hypothetical protein